MQREPLIDQDKKLIDTALDVITRRKNGDLTTVGCALETTSGQIYTGVNIEALRTSACSTCAEYSAIGTMYTTESAEIKTIVAVLADGKILDPCGRCREFIRQFGDPSVIMQDDTEQFKVKLSDLIPYWKTK